MHPGGLARSWDRALPPTPGRGATGEPSTTQGVVTANAMVPTPATPPPRATFFVAAAEVSVYEDLRAYDASFDPGGAGIDGHRWDFGDGDSAIGHRATHRYAEDGDYTLTLTVTTLDGRQATTAQPVSVRTHDVAITAFSVPRRARAGVQGLITVRVASERYAETVRVDLLKGVPGGGFETVGRETVEVPAGARRAVEARFAVSFSETDAAGGRVIFKATATLVGARDASPADNAALALPTTVRQSSGG